MEVMRIIAWKTLADYVASSKGHRNQKELETYLKNWRSVVSKADWKSSEDVLTQFGWASRISSDRVVFDVLTNRYRLVVSIDYEKKIVWIKWIGSHAEYDKIDVRKVRYVRR
jgi:mRNA interferase HigB